LRGRDVAGDVLVALGIDPADVRAAVLTVRAGGTSDEHAHWARRPQLPRRPFLRCSFCGRDLAEVGRYVRGGADICESCVAAAASALAGAERAGVQDRVTWLPPAVSGAGPADIAGAVAAIAAAFGVLRETKAPAVVREAVLEEPGDAVWVQAVHG